MFSTVLNRCHFSFQLILIGTSGTKSRNLSFLEIREGKGERGRLCPGLFQLSSITCTAIGSHSINNGNTTMYTLVIFKQPRFQMKIKVHRIQLRIPNIVLSFFYYDHIFFFYIYFSSNQNRKLRCHWLKVNVQRK